MWKRLLTRITDSLYIPEDILALRGRLLVHVSDTPSTFYRELRGLIARLEPVALIHTGDMADEVKIGLCPRLLPWYERKLSALSASCEFSRRNESSWFRGTTTTRRSWRTCWPAAG